MELVHVVTSIGGTCKCPWLFENPVGKISSLYRKPDYTFHPYEYGGYLPDYDVHPRYPEYIPARDAYVKRTCIWHGNGMIRPLTLPVDRPTKQPASFTKLGGRSIRTKRIRSETPRGFAMAVYTANS